jgi:hypothetical protein
VHSEYERVRNVGRVRDKNYEVGKRIRTPRNKAGRIKGRIHWRLTGSLVQHGKKKKKKKEWGEGEEECNFVPALVMKSEKIVRRSTLK